MRRDVRFIAKKLGADRTFATHTAATGPLSWMQLYEEVSHRIRSTGGRPTDPHWDFRRQIPFRKETWDLLNEIAESFHDNKINVSPAQIVAILVEHQMDALQEDPGGETPHSLQDLIKQKLG